MQPSIICSMLIFLLVLGLCGCSSSHWILQREPQVNAEFPNLALGRPIKNQDVFSLYTSPGSRRLSDLRPDVVVLLVFDQNCQYCDGAVLQANAIHKELMTKKMTQNAAVIGISVGDAEDEAEKFADKHNLLFPIFADPDLYYRQQLGRVGTPTFFAVDLSGTRCRTLLKNDGQLSDDPLLFIQRLMNEKELQSSRQDAAPDFSRPLQCFPGTEKAACE